MPGYQYARAVDKTGSDVYMRVSWKTVSRRTFVRYLPIFTFTIARLKCLYFYLIYNILFLFSLMMCH